MLYKYGRNRLIMEETDVEKRPRTASKDVRRRQLIDATITSISKHGISGTTMASVTRLADLSLGLVNFHFKSKDSLLEETLKFLAEEHREKWSTSVSRKDLTPQAKLLAIVEAQFHPKICSRKKLSVWFAFFGEASYRKSYRTITSQIDLERLQTTRALCQQLIDDGNYDEIDPHEAADTLEGLFDGFWLNMLMYPDRFSRLDALTQMQTYLKTTFPRHFGPHAKDGKI